MRRVAAAEDPNSFPTIICVSTADWDAPLWTNKQHLMMRLAERGFRVLYIDSPGHRAPAASAQDASRIWRRLRAWRPFARPVADRLLRDSPLVVPLHGRPLVDRLNARLLAARLRRNRRRWHLDDAVLWAYSPAALQLYDPSWHRCLVYHCVDDLGAYPGVSTERFRRAERALVERADVCIASSRPLLGHLRALGAEEPVYWPNPADTKAFAASRRPAGPHQGHPVAGFVGAIQEHKVDVELLRLCAERLPHWTFRLVGPVGLGLRSTTIDPASFPPNVTFTGTVARDSLPEVVAEFDVGLIPYRLNDYTEHVFPMKVFEYLAAGIPVVSTPLPSLVGEVEHVVFAEGDGFAAAIVAAGRDERGDERSRYAAGFSWERRVDEAVALVVNLRRD
ncbi:MAG: hypothetical protein QOE36_1133 [Gaiellaceae bacterium]|nr:hypothetical protein [Gaiellaceae bacterium]